MADLTPAEAAKTLREMRDERCHPECSEPLHADDKRDALLAGEDALEQVAGLRQRLDQVERAAREFLEVAGSAAATDSWGEYETMRRQLRQVLDEIERDRGGT